MGVPIWIDDQPRINWTAGAMQKSEDLNLVSSPTVAAAYAAHWGDRLAISVRFNRR